MGFSSEKMDFRFRYIVLFLGWFMSWEPGLRILIHRFASWIGSARRAVIYRIDLESNMQRNPIFQCFEGIKGSLYQPEPNKIYGKDISQIVRLKKSSTLQGSTSHNFPPINQMHQCVIPVCSKLSFMRTSNRLLHAKKHAKEMEDLNRSQVEKIGLGSGLKLRRLKI